MTANPKELEARARELLLMDDGHTRFGVIVNYRVYVDEAAAIRAITRALSQPAEPSDAAVEAVAKAMYAASHSNPMWDQFFGTVRDSYVNMARAAIAAMRGDAAPSEVLAVGCQRSHPHEEMSESCKKATVTVEVLAVATAMENCASVGNSAFPAALNRWAARLRAAVKEG